MSKKETKKKQGRFPKFNISWIYLAVFAGLLALQFVSSNYSGQTVESDFSELTDKLAKGHVSKVQVINRGQVYVFINPDTLSKRTSTKT